MKYEEHKKNRKKRRNKGKNKTKLRTFFEFNFMLMLLGIVVLTFALYGPFNGFRDWFITVGEMSMTHQWIPRIFYSEETISKVMANNRVDAVEEDTDTNFIVIKKDKDGEEKQYKNEYEKQLFGKNLDKNEYNIYDEGENYRIINIKGKGYTGLLAAIYDPSKVKTMTTSRLGSSGQYLTDIAKNNNSILAINGGRFYDKINNGSKPRGITFKDGKCVSSEVYTKAGGIIGFNNDDVLVLSSKCTIAQAKALNIRDCVSCGPFLIVNGKSSRVIGNGGWGTAPRTAIGQRKDGVVLFLVLDGRLAGRPGAGMNDLIEIFEHYGAYNAANLDGGTSSSMVYKGKVINDPVDASGTHRTRAIATAFGLIE